MKQTIRRIAAVIATLIFLVALASYIALKTPQFHRYALAKIIDQVQKTSGGKLEVRNWDFHFFPIVVNLYGITFHGSEDLAQKPFFTAEKLTVAVGARTLWGRKLQLKELLIQHPVASLRVSQDGKTNIPSPPGKTSSSTPITVWDLAVAHVLFTRGEVYYNDQERGFSAELYDLQTEVRFDPGATRYGGSISYHDGRLQYANYSPLSHNLEAQFRASPAGIALNPLVYTVGRSRISVQGEIRNYINPEVNADYDILIHTQDFAALSPKASPAGDVKLTGKLQYANPSHRSVIDAVVADGTLDSSALTITSPDGQIDFRRLKSDYRLGNGNLVAPLITADLLNGRVTADASVEHLDTTAISKVHASFDQISLEAARQSSKRAEARSIPLTGTLDGKLDTAWEGSVNALRLISEFTVHGAVWDYSAQPASSTPVDVSAHLNYDASRGTLELRQTRCEIPSLSVIVDGQIGQNSNLKVEAVAADLRQFTQFAASWRQALASSVRPLPIVAGSARLDAVVHGSIDHPEIRGKLNAQNLEVEGSQWPTAQLAFEANPSEFAIRNASLTNAGQGVLNFGGKVSLKHWAYSPSSPISANLSAKKISLTDIEHLTNHSYPITGNLSADVIFQGSQLNPSGHGSLELVKATAYDEPVQSFDIQFKATGNAISAKLNLSSPAGPAVADLTYTPTTRAYQLQLNAPSIVLEKLQTIRVKNMPLKGTLAASASGTGTLDNPQFAVALEIPRLEMQQTTMRGLKAQVNLAQQRANFTLRSDLTEAKGTIDLKNAYYTEASLDTKQIPLDLLLAAYAPSAPPGLTGSAEFSASFKGPLKDISRMELHVTVPRLSASYQGMQLENVAPLHADYANLVLVLQPGELHGTDTALHFEGRIPVDGAAPMNFDAKGSVNLRFLSILSSDLKATGTLALDVHSSGKLQDPDVRGQIQIEQVALSSRLAPLGLENLNGTLDVTRDKLQVRNLTGQVGGGQISVGGSIVYRPSLQFNLALQDKSVRLLYPEGIRTVSDGNLTLTGTAQSSTLGGRVLVDTLNFAPDFDLSNFVSQFSGTSVSSVGSFGDRVKLRIGVQSKQNLSAGTSQVTVEGAVNLQLVGTVSNPVVIGRMDLTAGDLFYRGKRYNLERGLISFDDPNQTSPVLNVQVTTTVEQYHLTLTLTGSTDKLVTSYMSEPPLASADIISLLFRGQTTTEAAATGISTDALLAGGGGKLSSGVERLVGISSLQISPLLGTNPSARIALQQRVTKNFLFTFSTDVSQPGSQQVQGEYQFSPRWSVRVEGDQLGGVAVDGRYHTKF
jgi:translocation and assembly module TamB